MSTSDRDIIGMLQRLVDVINVNIADEPEEQTRKPVVKKSSRSPKTKPKYKTVPAKRKSSPPKRKSKPSPKQFLWQDELNSSPKQSKPIKRKPSAKKRIESPRKLFILDKPKLHDASTQTSKALILDDDEFVNEIKEFSEGRMYSLSLDSNLSIKSRFFNIWVTRWYRISASNVRKVIGMNIANRKRASSASENSKQQTEQVTEQPRRKPLFDDEVSPINKRSPKQSQKSTSPHKLFDFNSDDSSDPEFHEQLRKIAEQYNHKKEQQSQSTSPQKLSLSPAASYNKSQDKEHLSLTDSDIEPPPAPRRSKNSSLMEQVQEANEEEEEEDSSAFQELNGSSGEEEEPQKIPPLDLGKVTKKSPVVPPLNIAKAIERKVDLEDDEKVQKNDKKKDEDKKSKKDKHDEDDEIEDKKSKKDKKKDEEDKNSKKDKKKKDDEDKDEDKKSKKDKKNKKKKDDEDENEDKKSKKDKKKDKIEDDEDEDEDKKSKKDKKKKDKKDKEDDEDKKSKKDKKDKKKKDKVEEDEDEDEDKKSKKDKKKKDKVDDQDKKSKKDKKKKDKDDEEDEDKKSKKDKKDKKKDKDEEDEDKKSKKDKKDKKKKDKKDDKDNDEDDEIKEKKDKKKDKKEKDGDKKSKKDKNDKDDDVKDKKEKKDKKKDDEDKKSKKDNKKDKDEDKKKEEKEQKKSDAKSKDTKSKDEKKSDSKDKDDKKKDSKLKEDKKPEDKKKDEKAKSPSKDDKKQKEEKKEKEDKLKKEEKPSKSPSKEEKKQEVKSQPVLENKSNDIPRLNISIGSSSEDDNPPSQPIPSLNLPAQIVDDDDEIEIRRGPPSEDSDSFNIYEVIEDSNSQPVVAEVVQDDVPANEEEEFFEEEEEHSQTLQEKLGEQFYDFNKLGNSSTESDSFAQNEAFAQMMFEEDDAQDKPRAVFDADETHSDGTAKIISTSKEEEEEENDIIAVDSDVDDVEVVDEPVEEINNQQTEKPVSSEPVQESKEENEEPIEENLFDDNNIEEEEEEKKEEIKPQPEQVQEERHIPHRLNTEDMINKRIEERMKQLQQFSQRDSSDISDSDSEIDDEPPAPRSQSPQQQAAEETKKDAPKSPVSSDEEFEIDVDDEDEPAVIQKSPINSNTPSSPVISPQQKIVEEMKAPKSPVSSDDEFEIEVDDDEVEEIKEEIKPQIQPKVEEKKQTPKSDNSEGDFEFLDDNEEEKDRPRAQVAPHHLSDNEEVIIESDNPIDIIGDEENNNNDVFFTMPNLNKSKGNNKVTAPPTVIPKVDISLGNNEDLNNVSSDNIVVDISDGDKIEQPSFDFSDSDGIQIDIIDEQPQKASVQVQQKQPEKPKEEQKQVPPLQKKSTFDAISFDEDSDIGDIEIDIGEDNDINDNKPINTFADLGKLPSPKSSNTKKQEVKKPVNQIEDIVISSSGADLDDGWQLDANDDLGKEKSSDNSDDYFV